MEAPSHGYTLELDVSTVESKQTPTTEELTAERQLDGRGKSIRM